jgi:diphthamide synthase (EF-2-diphthine--ammonia ligase)
VDRRFLTSDYCGRQYDADFLDALPSGVDACGENGEFHTFVYDGPLFATPLRCAVTAIEDYRAPEKFGGGSYAFARLTKTA